MALVDDLAQAIARFEGFFTPGSVAARNNNPGNLRAGIGQTGTDPNGYATFPDLATGWAALDNQISLNISRGLSLNTFFGGQRDTNGNVVPGGYPGYAPSGDANNPSHYAATIAGWLGIDPNASLSSIAASAPPASAGITQDQTPDTSTTLEAGIADGSILTGPGGITAIAVAALVALGLAAVVVLRR